MILQARRWGAAMRRRPLRTVLVASAVLVALYMGGIVFGVAGGGTLEDHWILHRGVSRPGHVLATLAVGRAAFRDVSIKDKLEYARRHDITLVVCEESLDWFRPVLWSKLKLVRLLLDHYDYVMWIDLDTVFVRPALAIDEWFPFTSHPSVEEYAGEPIVLVGPDYGESDKLDVNAGLMFFERSYWSTALIDLAYRHWWYILSDGWLTFNPEQLAMRAALRKIPREHVFIMHPYETWTLGVHAVERPMDFVVADSVYIMHWPNCRASGPGGGDCSGAFNTFAHNLRARLAAATTTVAHTTHTPG